MKKNIPILSRYLWWPLESVANWIGSFINRCPLKKNSTFSSYNQSQPWSMKIREIKKRIRANPDPKGGPHADTKIFNHPRR